MLIGVRLVLSFIFLPAGEISLGTRTYWNLHHIAHASANFNYGVYISGLYMSASRGGSRRGAKGPCPPLNREIVMLHHLLNHASARTHAYPNLHIHIHSVCV